MVYEPVLSRLHKIKTNSSLINGPKEKNLYLIPRVDAIQVRYLSDLYYALKVNVTG